MLLISNLQHGVAFSVKTTDSIYCQIRCRILSRLTRVEKAVKNTIIIVIHNVLVYIQMSQPTTCFGLFYLGHLQVGYITVVFLTAFSTRVSQLSSKIDNVDDTPKDR